MDNMDSIEVRIPDEIREYKEKYGGFTFRQWVGVVLVGLVCVPTYYVLLQNTVQTFAMVVTTLLAAPIGLIFFVPINGMPAEKMVPYFKRMFVDFGTILKFQTRPEKEVEKELMKDKKYQKKMKKLKKMEKKNQKRIERGSASEENEQLRAYRADVDDYYNTLRKEKIDSIVSSKINDVSVGFNPREKRRLHERSEELQKEKERKYLTEDENGYSNGNGGQDEKNQAESMRNPLEDKKSFEISNGLSNFDEYTEDSSQETQGINLSDSTIAQKSEEMSDFYETQEKNQLDSSNTDNDGLSSKGTSLSFDDSMSDDSEVIKSMDDREGESTMHSANADFVPSDLSTEIGSSQGMSKRQKVLQFYRTHPDSSMADCKAATGVEMKTIRRCWPKG